MKLLRDKRGMSHVPTAVMVIALAMVISVIMFFAYVQIQTIAIRNAMKTGLANLAVTISDDTYTALRESNFDAYAAKLTETSVYKDKLEAQYISDVESVILLSTSEYKVSNMKLTFSVNGKKLTYTCTCDVTFYINLFGGNIPAMVQSVVVEGSHTAKYGR